MENESTQKSLLPDFPDKQPEGEKVPDNAEDMKIVINLYDKITEEEESSKKQIKIKDSLVQLIDDFMEQRNLTSEQNAILARVRSRIIIEFISF